MGQRPTKDKKNLETWILELHKLTGDVVVSLLVENGEITYLSSQTKNLFFNEEVEDSDTPPQRPITKHKSITKTTKSNELNYFG